MNNKAKKLIYLLIFIALLFSYYLILERDRSIRLEASIIEFQEEYKDFIDTKEKKDIESIDELVNENAYNSQKINKYFEMIKSNSTKNFKESTLEEKYLLNLLKNENTENYSNSDQENYNELVKEAELLLKKIERDKEDSIKDLRLLSLVNTRITQIVTREAENYQEINDAYLDAKKNKNTTNVIIDDCFENQVNKDWEYLKSDSTKLCLALGLSNCQSDENFFGYTLNNPQKVNKQYKYDEYVSYEKNDFRLDQLQNFIKKNKNKKIYVEIYVQEILNTKIYKYNIIAYPLSYRLSCDI